MRRRLRWLGASEHDRRLLPEGSVNGPMPWVIAIMMFLTTLAAAAGIAVGALAIGIEHELDNKVTVQLTAPLASARREEARTAEATMRRSPEVETVRRLSEQEAAKLIEPWLGPDVDDEDFPIPILIDAELSPDASDGDYRQLAQEIESAAPSARIDRQSGLAAPVGRLMRTLAYLAAALVLLLAVATGAVVMLTARGALSNHRPVIEIAHLLGATDGQISQLFQRRITLDALFGGIVGFIAALAMILLIQWQVASSGLGLIGAPSLPWYGWLAIALLPLAGAGLAGLVAHFVIRRALKTMV